MRLRKAEEQLKLIKQGFPSKLEQEVRIASRFIVINNLPPTNHDIGRVYINGEMMQIPARIYFPEPSNLLFLLLNSNIKFIIHAIYTRHHDGFIRQKHVKQLLGAPQIYNENLVSYKWIIPYIVQLIAEYVVEIIMLIHRYSGRLSILRYAEFAEENPDFILSTCQKVVSYWNTYYREIFPQFIDYPAYQILYKLNLWNNTVAKRLIK